MEALMTLTNTQTMSSREISDITGKEHRNVLVDCDKLNESYKLMGLAEISAGVYLHPNTGGQQHREYHLSKMQSFDLMTGYNVELRIKVNRRWEELETKTIDFTNPQTVLMLAKNWAEEQQKRLQAEATIQKQLPKTIFADAVSASTDSILVGELSNYLRQNGIIIGRNRLFTWLRDNQYLCKSGESHNLPTQRSMELGLFEVKKNSHQQPTGEIIITATTKVTGKGQIYFVNKLIKP